MGSKYKRAIRSFINILRETSRPDRMSEAYPSWAAASAAANDYRTDTAIYGDQANRVRLGQEEPPIDVATLIAALALKSPSKVLDFGGGVALAYLRLQLSVPDLISLWRITDLPDVVEWGRVYFRDDPRISFSTDIPGSEF